MAILKCKMCGDNIEVSQDKTYGSCDSCGSTMTLPKINDDQKANLYNRANHFRRQNEFDKALAIYERMIGEDDSEAEAHWGAVLCRFGIEYVVDPASGKRVPTCHRASLESILNDVDYQAALDYTDDNRTKSLYKEETTYISEVQRDILAISQKEEPYDVFICYKETDAAGNRTQDSALAQDVYYQLTQEGYKVFFSRITLEDKLGQAYEPYIFAALNSAKVMVVIGTKPEYYNAVWVKNEWSRYLARMKKDKSLLLIPCYRDMDAYDIPEELAMLQSQDMSKIGFVQDLIRGIKKVLIKEESPVTKVVETVNVENGYSANVESLLKRVKLFLEDGQWESVTDYCDKILDMDAECAMAYVYQLCAKRNCNTDRDLALQKIPFSQDKEYEKALRFADEQLKEKLEQCNQTIVARIYEEDYQLALNEKVSQNYGGAIRIFESILGEVSSYKDIQLQLDECIQLDLLNKERRLAHFKKRREFMVSIEETRQQVQDKYALLNQAMTEHRQELEREWAQKEAEQKSLGIALFGKAKARKEQLSLEIQLLIDEITNQNRKIGEATCTATKNADMLKSTFHMVNKLNFTSISTEEGRSLGVRTDGTVIAVGGNDEGQCNVEGWIDIVAIFCGTKHTVGLKSDGTVVAVGNGEFRQCNVEDWTDVVAISAGGRHTVGLKADGTVLTAGYGGYGLDGVKDWTDIVAISAGYSRRTVGLKADGTVVVAGDNPCGKGKWPWSKVGRWSNIVAISTGVYHTVGLKSDGTVVSAGGNDQGQRNVEDWTDIVAISAGMYHTVGLKADGTVVIAADRYLGGSVDNWHDIVTVSAGGHHTVGLKVDGTVVAAGKNFKKPNTKGPCDVSDWRDIMIRDSQGEGVL